MPIPRTSTICARLPDEVKGDLQAIAKYFDMSVSDIVLRFCRDGIKNYTGMTTPNRIKLIKPELFTIEN